MTDNGAMDYKIIAIPFNDPTYNSYKSIDELPTHIYEEMKHFFSVYKTLEGKKTLVDECLGKDDAIRIVKDSIENYKKNLYMLLNK